MERKGWRERQRVDLRRGKEGERAYTTGGEKDNIVNEMGGLKEAIGGRMRWRKNNIIGWEEGNKKERRRYEGTSRKSDEGGREKGEGRKIVQSGPK